MWDGRDTRIYTKRIVKGGLISEHFSVWLHLQKSMPNYYPKFIQVDSAQNNDTVDSGNSELGFATNFVY